MNSLLGNKISNCDFSTYATCSWKFGCWHTSPMIKKWFTYYIKLIVNFLIMSFDFGEINLNLHLHSIQRTIFLSGQGNLLFKGYWQESFIFLTFVTHLALLARNRNGSKLQSFLYKIFSKKYFLNGNHMWPTLFVK